MPTQRVGSKNQPLRMVLADEQIKACADSNGGVQKPTIVHSIDRPMDQGPLLQRLGLLLSFTLLALLILSGCSGADRPRIENGQPAPDFSLESLNGEMIQLSELRGQIVAVRFWADWCPFCRREMRELDPLMRELQEQGVVLLAINTGQDRSRVERFVDRLDLSYPVLLDPDSALSRRYAVQAIPLTYFVDRDGVVRGRILGESTNATFLQMLDSIR